MKYLGIDYGAKRVGIAVSDEAGTMGFPKAILTNTPKLLEELGELIQKEGIGAVVLGDSKDYSGADNAINREARTLGDALADRYQLPVHYEPEMLTTQEARRAPGAMEHVDSSAAALILTSFLSKKSS